MWAFIQNQILSMNWLSELTSNLLQILGINISTKMGGSLQFFIYDTTKITILLCVLIFLISYIQSYFPPQQSKQIMSKFKGINANIIAALLGTVTPFCSCSSIPLFIGFTSAGIPIGATFSFLISSPMVDLASLLILTSVFGVKIAFFYVIFGLIIAIIGGIIIQKLNMEKYIEDFVLEAGKNAINLEDENLTKKDRINFASSQTKDTLLKVFPYILLGVGIGALIHNWIPGVLITSMLGNDNPFAIILAVIVGIPIYADIFGTIPIAEVLLAKGAALGVVLSFMMAITTLSLPSLIMLKQAIKMKLLMLFVGICIVGIVLVGYIFNILQEILI